MVVASGSPIDWVCSFLWQDRFASRSHLPRCEAELRKMLISKHNELMYRGLARYFH
jgi:hypothetical protein